jgi:hypothetical protein
MIALPANYDQLKPHEKRIVREQYILLQKGLCYHCKNPLDGDPTPEIMGEWLNRDLFPTGFLNNPIHLHHCHNTGKTIGAVHARCNGILWQYHGK